ncbi:MAG: GspH/FimT family protein [Thiohalocapsa sp.]
MHNNRRTIVGVTLIELMVALSVMVILLTVGVSQLGPMVARNNRSAEVNTMIGHLNFTRSEAIFRSSDITLCPVNAADPATCIEAPWSTGYAVVDENAGEALRYQKPAKGVDIRSTLNFSDGVTFEDDGSVTGAAGGSFFFCMSDESVEPRRLVVSGMGRVLISDDATCASDDDDGP